MKNKLLIGVGAGLLAATLTAAPALAATYTGDDIVLGDLVFDGFSYNEFYMYDDNASTAWSVANPQASNGGGPGQNTNWDDRGKGAIADGLGDSVYYLGLDATDNDMVCELTDTSGDSVIVCPTEVVEGVTMYPQVTVYGDQMLLRVVWVLTNNTAAAIDTEFYTETYSECDGNGLMQTSSGQTGSDATAWDMTENSWTVQRGATFFGEEWESEICGVETTAWQLGSAPVVATESTLDGDLDGQFLTFPVKLAPDETMGLAFYYYDAWASDGNVDVDGLENPAPYTANRQAAFDASVAYAAATFGTFSDVAQRHLPEGVTIANWGPTETALPDLPDTGASTAQLWGFGSLAAGLLAAGSVLMVRARRSN
jgi:hypothetical protein